MPRVALNFLLLAVVLSTNASATNQHALAQNAFCAAPWILPLRAFSVRLKMTANIVPSADRDEAPERLDRQEAADLEEQSPPTERPSCNHWTVAKAAHPSDADAEAWERFLGVKQAPKNKVIVTPPPPAAAPPPATAGDCHRTSRLSPRERVLY